MSYPCAVAARTACLALPLTTLALALSACGGGGDDAPGRTALTGPAGEVVAMGPDLLASGTYPVSNCTDIDGTAISRKIRLNDDGSLQWLDASANDAVLASYTPSSTGNDYRRFTLTAPDDYQLEATRYRAVDADGTSREVVVSFELRSTRVTVTWSAQSRIERCGNSVRLSSAPGRVQAQRDSVITPVVTIPVTLTDAIAARRIGSAVSLNNQLGGISDTGTLSYISGPSASTTQQVRRSITNSGQISLQLDNNAAVGWGDWIAAIRAANATNEGYYQETWDASAVGDQRTGIPSNPQVILSIGHPSLTYGNGSQATIELARNTDAPTPVIVFFGLDTAL